MLNSDTEHMVSNDFGNLIVFFPNEFSGHHSFYEISDHEYESNNSDSNTLQNDINTEDVISSPPSVQSNSTPKASPALVKFCRT